MEEIMSRILLIEDNESIVMGLEYLFESEGLISRTARNVKEARQALETESYDLVLLDVGLPDGNGFTLCQEIKNHYEIPVIFLTAKEEERDVVKGFDLGADDYVIKPFRNRELISRMKNVLRRNGKGEAKLTHGAVTIDTVSGKVYKEGEEVALTALEFRLLLTFFNYPKKLFTREEILNQIWDVAGNFVNDNTLTVYIKRIREKLGDSKGKLIETVRGVGYRLGGE
jgi:DNA-binding response OmpR family regulator